MPPAIGKWGLGIHTNSSKDIRMKLKLILSTMIAAVAMMANAQDTKRADVKAEAKAAKAEMIVIGSHGKGAIKTLLIGSVTQKVVALSPVPVLVVH